jgi:hypothetical protein
MAAMKTHLGWLALLFAGLATAAGAEPLSGESMHQLREGQVRVEYTRTDESGGAARVSILMQASAEDLWAILLSCERSFEYVDGLRECEVIEGDVEQALVRQSVKKSWILPRLDYVIEFRRQPFTAIDFRKTEGDLKLLEGLWRFVELADGTALLVTHEIRVQPAFPVPRWLVRRSIARDIPDMLVCLRALAGGSLDATSAVTDRGHCPVPDTGE